MSRERGAEGGVSADVSSGSCRHSTDFSLSSHANQELDGAGCQVPEHTRLGTCM